MKRTKEKKTTKVELTKSLFLSPYEFFENIKTNISLKDVVIVFILLLAFRTTFSIIYVWYIDKAAFGLLVAPKIVDILLSFILSILFSFVAAGITHGWVKIFGAHGNYVDSYKAYAFSRIPTFLFGWVPNLYMQIFVALYSLVLLVIGAQVLHKMTKIRSITAFGIAVVIIILLSYILTLWYPQN